MWYLSRIDEPPDPCGRWLALDNRSPKRRKARSPTIGTGSTAGSRRVSCPIDGETRSPEPRSNGDTKRVSKRGENVGVMLERVGGLVGAVLGAVMVVGAVFVLATMTFPGHGGTSALVVCLYLLGVGSMAIGVNFWREAVNVILVTSRLGVAVDAVPVTRSPR